MPGDEVHEEAVPSAEESSDAGRGRVGPRHAAPRKPLLNRLHVPAGKAIALAAMPSAVLMGMGFTPQLASAKPLPKNPFKGGACVSQPDKDEDAEEKEKAEKEKAEKEKAEKEKEQGGSKPGSGTSKPEPSPSDPSGGSDGGTGGEDPEPSPSPSEPGEGEEEDEDDGGLLGGVGDAIGDILSPEEKKAKEAEEEKEAEQKAEEEKASSDSGSGSSGSSSKADKPGDALGKVGDGLKDTTDKLGKGVEDAGKGAEDKLPSAGGDKAGKGVGEDGEGFPCVEEKKSAGKDEQTPNTLPNDPWTLKASSLGLHGLDYKGVVNITTQDGKTKQALKFTAKSVDIGDLHQIVDGPGGTKYHVRAAKGSTSTVKGGTVTMYTEKLKGNLFGLIPIVFDPEHPPPLNIPEAYFTDVTVTQAGQFGGNLTVPGLRNTVE